MFNKQNYIYPYVRFCYLELSLYPRYLDNAQRQVILFSLNAFS